MVVGTVAHERRGGRGWLRSTVVFVCLHSTVVKLWHRGAALIMHYSIPGVPGVPGASVHARCGAAA